MKTLWYKSDFKKNIALFIHSLRLPWGIKNIFFKLIPPPRYLTIKLLNGMNLRTDMRTNINKELLHTGTYEPLITKIFIKFLKKDDIIFDVGANVGYFSLLASSLIGDRGRCYSFESIKENASCLYENIGLNGVKNVEIIKKFVGDINNSTVEMFSPRPDNCGAGSIVNISSRKKIKVSTITLDAFCNQNNIKGVDFLKMDIEGGEALAINGMSNGLKNHIYKNLIIEFHGRHLKILKVDPQQLKQLFVMFGYRVYEIYPPSFLIDRTETGLQGSYMFFMLPENKFFGIHTIDVDKL